jgi:hypothetical protein
VGEGQQRPEGKASPTKIRTRDTSPRNGRKLFYMSQSPLLCPLVCCIMVSFVGISGSLFFFSSVLCLPARQSEDRRGNFTPLERSNLHTIGIEAHRHARVGRTHSSTHPSSPASRPPCAPVCVCWRRAAPLQGAVVLRAMHAVRPAAQLASPQAALLVLGRSSPRRCCGACWNAPVTAKHCRAVCCHHR